MAPFTRAVNMPCQDPPLTKSRWWRDRVKSHTLGRVPQTCPPDLLPTADAWWLDQLTADVPSFRHIWRKELEEASFPENNLHFLIEGYLLDYRVFRGTIPPDLDKLDPLLQELLQEQDRGLLKIHLVDIIRKEWGYPSQTSESVEFPNP